MASAVERAKDWWEGKAPRERRLLAVLGATAVICLLAWVAITIRGGLGAIEKRNEETREALAAIDRHRVTMASQAASQKPVVKIPDAALSLDTYLNGIITGVGLPEPTYPGPKETQKGAYTEVSLKVSLKELNIEQLKDLLEKIETTNPLVATTEVKVKRPNFGDPNKNLEVDFTVVTFYKKKAGAGGAAPASGGSGGTGGAAPASGGGAR